MKFLVLWHLEVSRISPQMMAAVMDQSNYGKKLEAEGKLECRYHVVGSHGGAWIYNVTSNEELDRLLAMSPVFNFSSYQVLPLAEMPDTGVRNAMSERRHITVEGIVQGVGFRPFVHGLACKTVWPGSS